MNGWLTHTSRLTTDFGAVIDMFPNPDSCSMEGDDKEFGRIVERSCSQLMLAATRPDQHAATKALKANGFQKIATGHRNGASGLITLWGRYYKCREKSVPYGGTINCCGIVLRLNALPGQWDYQYLMHIHRFTKKAFPKSKIPKEMTLFASTRLANYYVRNEVKFFKPLEI